MKGAKNVEQLRNADVLDDSESDDDFYQVVYVDDDRVSGALEAVINSMDQAGWHPVQFVCPGRSIGVDRDTSDQWTLIFSRKMHPSWFEHREPPL
jgi:hypothetical protein